jgi:DNA-binding MarR family transcriptional regulator
LTEDADNAAHLFRYMTEVMILAQLGTNAFERLLPNGMTMAQFGVLNHLCRLGKVQAPAEIARAMQVRRSTMTSTLGALLRAGHVRIERDQTDGRAKVVSVTEAGRQARSIALARVRPEIEAIGELLPPGSVAAGLPSLEMLRKLMDQRRD